ncbi:MAG: hypothetical protein ABFS12_02875 [Bacteroidota bacterium]
MKSKVTITYIFIILLSFSANVILGQDSTKIKEKVDTKGHGNKFVDNDGDGYNDNAPDHDGDGIPNGLDEDYIKLKKNRSREYVDLDGDGINDNLMMRGKNKQQMKRYKGEDMNLKPQDGSGKNSDGSKGPYKGKGNGNGRGGN